MLELKINGKAVGFDGLERELMRTLAASAARELRERVGTIRHPETGEFPTVVVEGSSLDDMALRVEGSQSLLEIVKSRLTPQEAEATTFITLDTAKIPRVFLSYGFEDRDLAEKIAEFFTAKGIEVWWAEWELDAGDSIRRKIDAGVEQCTHFVVLLTPTSITRPWVNEEIDAGFVRKVGEKSRLIPLRAGLGVDALPPLMSGMLSPEVNADASNLQPLVDDIFGVSRKPPRGPAPAVVAGPKTGYSPAATAVAGLFVQSSQHAMFADPQLSIADIKAKSGLSEEDVIDALYELRHRVDQRFDSVWPKDTLLSEFDRYWQHWNPADDGLKLAADLANDPEFPAAPSEIAVRYGWTPRRLNPAMAYLRERNVVHMWEVLDSGPYLTSHITKTDATRRFVKSRS